MEKDHQQVVQVALNLDALQLQPILTAARIDPNLAREVQAMNGINNIDFGGLYGYSLKLRAARVLAKQAQKVSI